MIRNITESIFKKNTKNIAVTFLASIVFVFCIFPFLIKLNFLENLLSKVTLETVIGIISAILIFIILFWNKAKRFSQRYRNTCKLSEPSLVYPDYIFIFLFLSCLLILLFQQHPILKTSIGFWAFLAFNIILLLVGLLFICFIKCKRSEGSSTTKENHSLSDEAIKFANQDLLGRDKFVEDLSKEIACLPFNDSFVFSIHGKWGEGKTSIINLLLEKLEDNSNFIVVNFDPWHFNDEKAIMSAFYGEIERTLNKRFIFSNLRKAFNKYQKIVTSGLLQAGIINNLCFGEESIKDVKQRIESYIERIGIKLLIIVDDIDRLQADEMLLVFKLVRLNTNFKNTIFLLSFDQITIQEVLEDNSKTDPVFLEKIVQKPIRLPAIEQHKVDGFIDTYLNKLFDEINIAKDERQKFEEDFPYLFQTQIKKLFKTLRHAKRYINGLSSTLPPIKTEVCLHDFCILEIIRIFYPKVYDDIWNNPWFYVPVDRFIDINSFSSSPFPYSENEDAKYSLIKKHINAICENEKEGIVLKELLKVIFFIVVKRAFSSSGYSDEVVGSYRVEKRVTHPDSFRKYFMLKVPSSEMSDEYIKATAETWNSEEEEDKKECIIEEAVFENQKKGQLIEFINKIILFKCELSHETATSIIRVIYKKAACFSKGKSGYLEQTEYEKAFSLLLNLIVTNIKKDEIQNILEEAVATTPYFHFAVLLVLQCRREVKEKVLNIYGITISERIQDIVADRLKKYYIDAKRDIFDELEENEWVFVLYQWSSDWMSSTDKHKEIVCDYILSLIKNNSKKFIKFLMCLQEPMREGNIIFDMNKLGKAYVMDKFKELASTFQHDKLLSSEQKEAIRVFIESPSETDIPNDVTP